MTNQETDWGLGLLALSVVMLRGCPGKLSLKEFEAGLELKSYINCKRFGGLVWSLPCTCFLEGCVAKFGPFNA